ncbi:MAG: DUF1294 domain-containing protein [Comamonadaceae bacterium]|nr:DUF1294 domain-containing protein [Comamonadaceae bacterium]
MHKQGKVVAWDATKGFGFIRSTQTLEDVYFHIRDWEGVNPPALQAAVEFEEIHVGGKGPRAMGVVPVEGPTVPKTSREALRRERAEIRLRKTQESQEHETPPPATAVARSRYAQQRAARREQWQLGAAAGLLGLWLILLLAGIWMRRMPWVVVPGLALLNIATFFAYWRDKLAAEEQAIRIREEVLHAMALLGGWPAAWLAHRVLPNKTIQRSFQAMFWLTVLLHMLALATWVLWPLFFPEPLPPPPEPY